MDQVMSILSVAPAESNLRFRLGKMSAKNLKLKSSLCALLGFDELQLQAGEDGEDEQHI
jgi:hypothetical protein